MDGEDDFKEFIHHEIHMNGRARTPGAPLLLRG